MRGRIPKPTTLKVLAGNAGHRKVDAGAEPAPPAGAPQPPDFLSAFAKNKWFEIIAIMSQVPGWLTKMDADVLTTYCSAFSEFKEAEMSLPGLRKRHARMRDATKKARLWGELCAMIGQRRQAMKQMKEMGGEFGWSAVSRTRMRINAGQGELDLTDSVKGDQAPESPFEKTQRLAQRA